jgi:hypothetical protein
MSVDSILHGIIRGTQISQYGNGLIYIPFGTFLSMQLRCISFDPHGVQKCESEMRTTDMYFYPTQNSINGMGKFDCHIDCSHLEGVSQTPIIPSRMVLDTLVPAVYHNLFIGVVGSGNTIDGSTPRASTPDLLHTRMTASPHETAVLPHRAYACTHMLMNGVRLCDRGYVVQSDAEYPFVFNAGLTCNVAIFYNGSLKFSFRNGDAILTYSRLACTYFNPMVETDETMSIIQQVAKHALQSLIRGIQEFYMNNDETGKLMLLEPDDQHFLDGFTKTPDNVTRLKQLCKQFMLRWMHRESRMTWSTMFAVEDIFEDAYEDGFQTIISVMQGIHLENQRSKSRSPM